MTSKIKIPFNIPPVTGKESEYLMKVIENRRISGDGEFVHKCSRWFEERLGCIKALLTTSGTHALEMSAILTGIEKGDEVIMPSFTFVSTANAFVLRGARIVFIDVRPDTMNLDETLISGAVTDRTRAIVPIHYAGVSCEMQPIMETAANHNLMVIEDAAQGVMSSYRGRPLGTIGHLGCFSFHETKNYTSGEGGALIVNDNRFTRRAEIIREKGTNRSEFIRGEVDKYTWTDIGSSYLPSELNAAFLYAQLEMADRINSDRLKSWNNYYEYLTPLSEKGCIELPVIPYDCEHNASIFFIKVRDKEERNRVIRYLDDNGVQGVFHYIPLHSSTAGKKYGRFHGNDIYTTKESERLLRLPIYYGIETSVIEYIAQLMESFYS